MSCSIEAFKTSKTPRMPLERWIITGRSVDKECLEHLEPHLKPWITESSSVDGWINQIFQRPLLPRVSPSSTQQSSYRHPTKDSPSSAMQSVHLPAVNCGSEGRGEGLGLGGSTRHLPSTVILRPGCVPGLSPLPFAIHHHRHLLGSA
jgi:hypothetical protein